MTSRRFPFSLQRAPEQNQVSATAHPLQQTFTGPGFDMPHDRDDEISVAVLDAIDAIQRKRHTRRARAFGRFEARSTTR